MQTFKEHLRRQDVEVMNESVDDKFIKKIEVLVQDMKDEKEWTKEDYSYYSQRFAAISQTLERMK